MRSDKQRLVHDLLDNQPHRNATLAAAGVVLRRRRQWHAAKHIIALLALVSIVSVWLWPQPKAPSSAPVAQAHPKTAAGLRVKLLTDEELLSLFPNTPVGLATLPNGKKLLIFPRPSDAARIMLPVPPTDATAPVSRPSRPIAGGRA
jgi:hypothetical protein